MTVVSKVKREFLRAVPKISKGIGFPFNLSADPAHKTGKLFDSPLAKYVMQNLRYDLPSYTADAQYMLLAELSAGNKKITAEQGIVCIGEKVNKLGDELAVPYRVQRSLCMRILFTPKQVCLRNFAAECVDLESLAEDFSKTPFYDVEKFARGIRGNIFMECPSGFTFQKGWMP